MTTPEIISRQEAREIGQKWYYTGKPCKRGHIDYRFVSNKRCYSCAKEKSVEWREKNPEKYKEMRRKSHYKNADKESEYAKEYCQRPEVKERRREKMKRRYQENPEYYREKQRQFRLENPELEKSYRKKHYELNKERINHLKRLQYIKNKDKVLERVSYRRAIKLNAIPEWFDKEEVDYIYKIAKEKGLTVDHIVPLVNDYVCGLHVQDNLRCVSWSLNSHKSNRYWPDMPSHLPDDDLE